jgi:hypothetical protein
VDCSLYDPKSGIDEKDPFCREVRGTRYGPNSREVKRLQQVTGVNVPIRWINGNGEWEYAYEDWSDEPANREAYDYRIRSFGTPFGQKIHPQRFTLPQVHNI